MDVGVEIGPGRLRGVRRPSGIACFLGVPFAAPAVGARRFLPPEPPEPWAGVRDALSFAASAPQRDVAGPLGEMIGIGAGDIDEDCLHLNVFTPGPGGSPRPVLVWVHGGGNLVGSAAQPRMDGERLARRGDVVVVTFNYRLGALGFLCARELGASGNQALLDQVAALRFVRSEIAAFGGGPSNVTVFGQSAGGIDIAELLALDPAKGAFDKAILMSGSLRPHVSREQAERTAQLFAEPFGGIGKLRDVEVGALIDRQAELARDPIAGVHRFAPTRDGELIRDPAERAIAQGRIDRGIPLLCGTTRHEWNLFSAFDPRATDLTPETLAHRIERRAPGRSSAAIELYRETRAARGEPTDPLSLWNAFMTDESFRMPAIRTAKLHARHTPATYVYRFDRESPALGGRLGACHSIDVPFVFGTHDLETLQPLLGSEAGIGALSSRIMDAFTAFARSGDPTTTALPTWPRYAEDTRHVMLFADACRTEADPEAEQRHFWETLR